MCVTPNVTYSLDFFYKIKVFNTVRKTVETTPTAQLYVAIEKNEKFIWTVRSHYRIVYTEQL